MAFLNLEMKKEIEHIFKDYFEKFESEVKAIIWDKIKKAID